MCFSQCFGFKMTTKFNNCRSALAIFFSAIILFAEEHHEFKCMYEALVILINKFKLLNYFVTVRGIGIEDADHGLLEQNPSREGKS